MAKRAADPTKPRRPRGRPPIVRSFYGSALAAAERIALEYASDLEGLDGEVDLLRTKLRTLLELADKQGKFIDRPDGLKLMFRGVDLLRRLLATRYRLSAEAQQDLSSSIAGLIQGVAAEFYPEGRHGA